MVGGAERPGNGAVEKLPCRLLRVGEPQRIPQGRAVLREQALRQFGSHRHADAHLMALVADGGAGVIGRGRCRYAGLCVGCGHRHVDRSIAAKTEGAAIGSGFQFPEARQLRILRVATLLVADRDHAGGGQAGIDGLQRLVVGLRAGEHRWRRWNQGRRQRLLLRPAVEAGQACFCIAIQLPALLPRQVGRGKGAGRHGRGRRLRPAGAEARQQRQQGKRGESRAFPVCWRAGK